MHIRTYRDEALEDFIRDQFPEFGTLGEAKREREREREEMIWSESSKQKQKQKQKQKKERKGKRGDR